MSLEDLESGQSLTLNGSQQLQQQRQIPSQDVVAGLFLIRTAVASFQRLLNSLGTAKDTLGLRQKLRKTRLRIGRLVKDTWAKLKQASETDRHTEVIASKKIADAKLAKDLESVLQEFQKAQQLEAQRETAYAPFVPKEVLQPSNTENEQEIGSSEGSEKFALLVEARRPEVPVLENVVVFDEAIIQEREQGIKEIQQQIGEVNGILKDLAVLVHDQGTIIEEISSNLESSRAETAQATSQLEKASKTQRSNSSVACLLLVILGIILIIVVIIVVA